MEEPPPPPEKPKPSFFRAKDRKLHIMQALIPRNAAQVARISTSFSASFSDLLKQQRSESPSELPLGQRTWSMPADSPLLHQPESPESPLEKSTWSIGPGEAHVEPGMGHGSMGAYVNGMEPGSV